MESCRTCVEGAGPGVPHQLAVGHFVVGLGLEGRTYLKAGVAGVAVGPAVPACGEAMQGEGVLPVYGEGPQASGDGREGVGGKGPRG